MLVYGKSGCHLCDDALELLARLRPEYPHEVTKIDITSDAQLFRRYDVRIPVIVVDGVDELDPPITEERLRRALS